MGSFDIELPVRADGTFDLPPGFTLENALVNAPADPNDLLPFGFTFADFEITPAGEGRGFSIRTRDPGVTNPRFGDANTLMMGGMLRQTKITIYDCRGEPYTLEVQFKKVAENVWRWEAFFPNEPGLVAFRPYGELVFGPCGRLVEPRSGFASLEIPFSLLGRQNATIELNFGGLGDEGGVTQFATASTTRGFYQDGYTMGTLFNFNTGLDGTIVGQFTNGQNIPLYRVALAMFPNPQGLEKIGDTMFRESINSGMANINAAMEGGAGTIVGSTLEMSNVDLTEEFTRLIISQRGFQANTRVVTTSDQILEEVVNMKR